MKYALGIDIGGTKLSVTIADIEGGNLNFKGKRKIPTPKDGGYKESLRLISGACEELLQETAAGELCGVGISCGGPLDSRNGIILSPPNLTGWDEVPVVQYFEEQFKVPAKLQNDADACALAEWKFGAGRGFRNVIFLTFGTGFGAGLILDGRLYSGTNDMAGEIGHCRSPIVDGYAPVGYGKSGSFEGFCSGGGIAELGRAVAMERIQMGKPAGFCPNIQSLSSLTAKSIGDAAEAGDEAAAEVYRCSGRHLGASISFLTDVLNPEVIIIGSIYARSEGLLRDSAMEVFNRETLSRNRSVCRVVPAQLGDELGDVAAISIVSQNFPGIYNNK